MIKIGDIKAAAQAADEGYTGAHPRDSNNWRANEAFCLACKPKVVLALCEAVEAANEVERLKSLPMRVPTAASEMARITQATYGIEKRAAAAALRKALEPFTEQK